MDIQSTKIELMQLLLETQKEQVLANIKEIFKQEKELDFWDDLTENDQIAINEGLSQIENGQTFSKDEIKAEIEKKFGF